ncbi:IclR family transcriptional regulator [Bacillus sp. FJAT-29790]|uniref:IclR family transcriptional regulator n=1 Tax=Bacillus sp. FJAT-29790 TaxID=1895002 RepID=UPI001C23396D|nr:IclR family transcriptional regulator [Bacillus sp. FJAT-29790]MBU8877574.1 IclR family transcriptional regulator [Bacillus sp. FJAT-29790]
MEKKYWVPAIERVDKILNIIAYHPAEYRLIDFSNELAINKSSLFSLLNTLEVLGWVKKEKDDTYSLGMKLGILSASYFRQFDLINTFSLEALTSIEKVDETYQLSILDGKEIVYLAKKEGSSPVRVATDPGMKFLAHATAMGKVQLSQYTYEQLKGLYPDETLEQKTKYTVKSVDELWQQILKIQKDGFIKEYQEAVEDFCCIAAPIINHENRIIAAVSVTILSTNWEDKQEVAHEEIINLANRISLKAGFLAPVNS